MYKITCYRTIIRLADSASIPFDPANADYQKYLAWVTLGNIAPIDPPPTPTAADIRQSGAHDVVKAIPLWAKWTQQQLLDWWTPRLAPAVINVLAIPQGAKDALNALASAVLSIGQLLIAVRDQLWPDLPDLP